MGHFAALWGTLRGAHGTLVAVADTYPNLGWEGRHFQPVDRLAAALARTRPQTGGILLSVPAGHQDAVRHLVTEVGLEPQWWDNGTALPWSRG